MEVRITHVATPVPGAGQRFPDALGVIEGADAGRVFVPGWLPCGECGRCRRALVTACAHGRPSLPDPAAPPRGLTLDLPERFLTPVDVPAEAERLSDFAAVCAGFAATLIDATASAGMTPGDLAIWLGDDFVSAAGSALSAARGCSAFRAARTGDDVSGVTTLSLADNITDWLAALAVAESAGPSGRRARRLFVSGGGTEHLAQACALADPGSTIAVLGAAGAALGSGLVLPARCRLLALGGYHPDLVPEGLAALRRGEIAFGRLTTTLAVTPLG
jgi:threonine dehydrogenase-like Zn-dependent dehydrogenase